MPSRIETPFTNEHFAAFLEKMVGQPYWYGTTGNRATKSLLTRKTKQYPSHYTSSRTKKYEKDIAAGKIVCDCIGGCKAYAWTNGGESILKGLSDKTVSLNAKYGANGCPDKSANGMFSYAKSKGMPNGPIKTLPNAPGIALWKDGHVGYTLDGTWAVEWRSYAYGCQKTRIASRGFQSWYYLPFLSYDASVAPRETLLRRGSEGENVRVLQNRLIALGYKLPKYGADGDFGRETEEALIRFQQDNALVADGIAGEATYQAMDALEKANASDAEASAPAENGKTLYIASNGGVVNIRSGNGENYPVLFKAENQAAFPFVASADNGWNAIALSDDVGWVSGKYSRV